MQLWPIDIIQVKQYATCCLVTYEPHCKLQKQLSLHINIVGCHQLWMMWKHFSSSFLSKLVVVTSHSYIYNVKPFCNWICDYKSFLPHAMEDNWNDNHKNCWLGHKSNTRVSRFLVVIQNEHATWMCQAQCRKPTNVKFNITKTFARLQNF